MKLQSNHKFERIRPAKINEALKALKRLHPQYSDIPIEYLDETGCTMVEKETVDEAGNTVVEKEFWKHYDESEDESDEDDDDSSSEEQEPQEDIDVDELESSTDESMETQSSDDDQDLTDQ